MDTKKFGDLLHRAASKPLFRTIGLIALVGSANCSAELTCDSSDGNCAESGEAITAAIRNAAPTRGDSVTRGDFTTSSATPSSVLASQTIANINDGDTDTYWSSALHVGAAAKETLSFWWSQGMQQTNYVKLLPNYNENVAQGFPVAFQIYYSNGTDWVLASTYKSYPTPFRNDWIVLPLPSTVTANGISIVATTLGTTAGGKHALAFAEVLAGYDAGFNQFSWASNDPVDLKGRNEIQGVTADTFNPSKFTATTQWNFDERKVVVEPLAGAHRNIYAPQAVSNGNGSWDVFFGGWDGAATTNDRIHRTTTTDNFLSFGSHAVVIDHGDDIHANNDSIVRVSDGDWRMAYTVLPQGPQDTTPNHTCTATSTDGIHWESPVCDAAHLVQMSGYDNWQYSNVNGANALYIDPQGVYHLYFEDTLVSKPSPAAAPTPGVLHATSTDGINYTYQGQVLTTNKTMQDIKAFEYGGQTYYFSVYTVNAWAVWNMITTDLSSFGDVNTQPPILFESVGFDTAQKRPGAIDGPTFDGSTVPDNAISSAGIVQDGTHIYGVLYGASRNLVNERIYARWLQKRVLFKNSAVTWGNVEYGYGPTTERFALDAADSVETGNFYVYDVDGTTLLYTSPAVTMRAGDIWHYTGAAQSATTFSGAALVDRNSGKCLDVTGASTTNGTALQLYDCNGGTPQQFTRDASGALSVTIGGVKKCVDVTNAQDADGAALQLWDCNQGVQQQWAFDGVQLEAFNGGNIAGGSALECMSVANSGVANGTPIQIATCSGSANQNFEVVAK